MARPKKEEAPKEDKIYPLLMKKGESTKFARNAEIEKVLLNEGWEVA